MSIEQLNQAFKADINKSSTKFILVALSDYANEIGEAYPTVQTINAKTSLNRKTIISGLAELVDLGFIQDTGKRVGRTKSIPVWQILTPSKQSQKRNQSKSGTATEAVPILPPSNPENGTAKQSQKRDIEPSVLLTINKPSVISSTVVADYLAAKIKNNNPKTRPNPRSWEVDIEKAIRIDGRTQDDLISIIDWMYQGDAFWSGVILSGKKLREKFDAMIMQKNRGSKPQRAREIQDKDYTQGIEGFMQ